MFSFSKTFMAITLHIFCSYCIFSGNYAIKSTFSDFEYITSIGKTIRLMTIDDFERTKDLRKQENIFEIEPVDKMYQQNGDKMLYYIKSDNKYLGRKKSDPGVILTDEVESIYREWEIEMTIDGRFIIKTNDFCLRKGSFDTELSGSYVHGKLCSIKEDVMRFVLKPVRNNLDDYLKMLMAKDNIVF